jgi:hypothetical protein
MSVYNRITALERIAGDTNANDIPPLIYFKGGKSDNTPDKDEAFKRYKEQYKDDSRYRVLHHINSFTELERYAEQHNLLDRLTAVVFMDKPAEGKQANNRTVSNSLTSDKYNYRKLKQEGNNE